MKEPDDNDKFGDDGLKIRSQSEVWTKLGSVPETQERARLALGNLAESKRCRVCRKYYRQGKGTGRKLWGLGLCLASACYSMLLSSNSPLEVRVHQVEELISRKRNASMEKKKAILSHTRQDKLQESVMFRKVDDG